MEKPRKLKLESICIGDTLRITWAHEDLERSAVGIVAARDIWSHGVEYTTAKGHPILTIFRDGNTEPNNARVTLLKRNASNQPTLEGLDV